MSTNKKRGVKGCNDLVLAQRANMREADSQQNALKVLHQLQRRRICKLEEEITEVKKDLRSIHQQEPDYFYKSRPASSTEPPTNRSSGSWESKRGGRPITAPIPGSKVEPMPAATRPCWGRRTSHISSKPSLSRQNTTNMKTEEAKKNKPPSKWKDNKTRAKIDAVKVVTQKHIEAKKRQKEENPEFTLVELDRIKNINRWLSIKKMPEQNQIPPIAMKYIHSQKMELNFDLSKFLEKKFPPTEPTNSKKVTSNVSEEVIEQQKMQFNNMTAARALMKFKRRLEIFRAKTDEERAQEKIWGDLKNVRYLRIPGVPMEPDSYSSAIFSD